MANQQFTKQIIKKVILANPANIDELAKIKRDVSKIWDIKLPTNAHLLQAYHKLLNNGEVIKNQHLEKILIKRKTRTISGVAPVTVLTKPFPCPGKCIYCPAEPNMPKSYLSNEPAAMRGVSNEFDPYRQMINRLSALRANGHHPDKIELIILGGTWSSYPKDYQKEFIFQSYKAANHFGGNKDDGEKLEGSQKINENANFRIIGISIETRPDHVCRQEIERWREYGVTRVQLGAQHIDDNVQKITKRGHDTNALIRATKMIKDSGLKLDYHIMQNLPGSNPKLDLWCASEIVTNSDFQPDQIKIYPTIANEHAELYNWYKEGRWKPYTDETLINLLMAIKKVVPYRVRINRVVRDFPSESIIAGNKVTNLREFIQKRMQKANVICRCIRCSEAKHREVNWKDVHLFVDSYSASSGTEYFINFASRDRKILYAFCRLRIPRNKNKNHFIPEIRGAALIRELHTFGRLVPIHSSSTGEPQHSGFGKKLMSIAEHIAKDRGYAKMAVISGIGVKQYYYKLGYHQDGTYVTKKL